ncbi:MAG: preprotein translocase subunit SecY [Alphaproteobacteria bacterium]|nr:preprotein translocase subunit SecY [Alphaproteobacteria bacterium]
MRSASDKLAATVNLGVLSKATELKKRLWFILGALIIYRIGTYIPIPGVDALVLEQVMNKNAGGMLAIFNMFSGGALGRMTIFTLSIMPYITASIIIQLMTSISKSLEALKKEGESGRRKINQYTRYCTVLFASFQAFGIAKALENMSINGVSPVIDPGTFFMCTTVVTLVGGTMFLMWLGEQITQRGIGNGTSLIIFSGVVAGLPTALGSTFEMGRTGALSTFFVLGLMVLAVSLIMFIVFMERAQRRIVVQYPKRQMGNKIFGGDSSHLPLKLNTAGVIPPIFASSLLLFPVTLASFRGNSTESSFLDTVILYLSHGKPLYMLMYVALIVFFSFFYTAVVFNPDETADNLKKYGGFIPGRRPGKHTAEYLDFVLTRLTTLGAIYLSIICIFPELLISKYSVPFYLGGTSLLIVVNVVMDTMGQIQTHLFSHQYEGLIRKAKLRGRTK